MASLGQKMCQQVLHEETLVCGMTLVSRDTEDHVHASVCRETAALQSRNSFTHMFLSCLVSNDIGFMQKSSLCHVSQSCKAPGKCKAVSQYPGFAAQGKKIRNQAADSAQQWERRGGPTSRKGFCQDLCSDVPSSPAPRENPGT